MVRAVLQIYIYKSDYTYRGCTEGWDLTEESLVLEPAVDRWAELSRFADTKPKEGEPKIDFMRLSAGVMAPRHRATSNRIDGLLSKMVDTSHVVKYSEDTDKNLDYLFTYLQLDMINILAENCTREPDDPEEVLSSI